MNKLNNHHHHRHENLFDMEFDKRVIPVVVS